MICCMLKSRDLFHVSVADIVLWSPDATVYVVVADRKLDIYSVEVGQCIDFLSEQ